MAELKDLIGKTLIEIERIYDLNSEELILITKEGKQYKFYHTQDCCECVYIESIVGDLKDLIGSPILVAEEVVSHENPRSVDYSDSFTWTFYKLATFRGYVDIRWYGTSNGYYSERVTFEEIVPNG